MKRVLTSLVLVLLCTISVLAQGNITVTGTVVDVKNVPLAGVAVIQQGTTNGSATGADGKYSITLPKGSVIEFSCIGYNAQTIKAFNAIVDIVMEEDNLLLEETVVVGYGVQKKSSVTGAISQVKSEDITNRSVTDIAGSLQGKTAGVQIVSSSGAPGAESSIRIRGYSSNSSSDPLYVVDGLRTKNISNIDPSDIESIEVLKDAASAAIYGASAGNGVVLVTTKRASKGVRRISYDMQLSWQQMAHVPDVLNAKDYLTWVREGSLVSDEIISKYYDGKTDTNWADVAFETGFMQRHNVAFSGANNNGSIYAAVSFLDNNGPVIGDKDQFKRLSATVNADYKIKDWLKFTTNNSFGYASAKFINAGGMYSLPAATIQMDPLTPVTYSKDNVPAHICRLSLTRAIHSSRPLTVTTIRCLLSRNPTTSTLTSPSTIRTRVMRCSNFAVPPHLTSLLSRDLYLPLVSVTTSEASSTRARHGLTSRILIPTLIM